MDFPAEEVLKVLHQVKARVQTELFTEKKLITFLLPKEGKSIVLESQVDMVDQFLGGSIFGGREKETTTLKIGDNVAVQLLQNEIRNRVDR